MSTFFVLGGVRPSVMASLTSPMNSSLRALTVFCACSVSGYVDREVCRRAISMNISSQLDRGLCFKASIACSVCCGVGLRHFGKVIKKRSRRPCPWSMSETRRAQKVPG